eukprot:TRINITY_DN11325_c0_g1_i1.p1 TRINITY_DN11325_c0_g1~~TRINITY_DN11325_c0_g1_i1.p1  ORF type:complete len:340 (+),score=32.35 TRINITY_DN11325_c0_g1_i1:27-1022(+)
MTDIAEFIKIVEGFSLQPAAPDCSYFTEVTKLFTGAYTKFRETTENSYCEVHKNHLLPLLEKICTSPVPQAENEFGFWVNFIGTCAICLTHESNTLLVLDKLMRDPAASGMSAKYPHRPLPEGFEPETSAVIAEKLIQQLFGLLKVNSTPTQACSTIVTLFCVARNRSCFFQTIIPELCQLAIQSGSSPALVYLMNNSVKYQLRNALLFLLRMPSTEVYREQIVAGLAQLRFDASILSLRIDELVSSICRGHIKERRPENPPKRRRVLPKFIGAMATNEMTTLGLSLSRIANCVIASLRALPMTMQPHMLRQRQTEGISEIVNNMVTTIPS